MAWREPTPRNAFAVTGMLEQNQVSQSVQSTQYTALAVMLVAASTVCRYSDHVVFPLRDEML